MEKGAFKGKHFLALEDFTPEELQEAVSFCHARGVKVHVTLNTLVYDRELAGLADAVRAVAAAGADAVIAELEPIQARYRQISADKAYLNEVMTKGAERAAKLAARTMSKVRRKVGLAATQL